MGSHFTFSSVVQMLIIIIVLFLPHGPSETTSFTSFLTLPWVTYGAGKAVS